MASVVAEGPAGGATVANAAAANKIMVEVKISRATEATYRICDVFGSHSMPCKAARRDLSSLDEGLLGQVDRPCEDDHKMLQECMESQSRRLDDMNRRLGNVGAEVKREGRKDRAQVRGFTQRHAHGSAPAVDDLHRLLSPMGPKGGAQAQGSAADHSNLGESWGTATVQQRLVAEMLEMKKALQKATAKGGCKKDDTGRVAKLKAALKQARADIKVARASTKTATTKKKAKRSGTRALRVSILGGEAQKCADQQGTWCPRHNFVGQSSPS